MSIFKKLKDKAKHLGLDIEIYKGKENKEAEGGYYYDEKRIYIITFNNMVSNNYLTISPVLAHEIGHHISHTKMSKKVVRTLQRDYSKINQPFFLSNKRCRQRVYKEEQNAWKIGRNLLKKLGYKDWKRFNNIRDGNLFLYKVDLGL